MIQNNMSLDRMRQDRFQFGPDWSLYGPFGGDTTRIMTIKPKHSGLVNSLQQCR